MVVLVLTVGLLYYGYQASISSGGTCSIWQWNFGCWGALSPGCWFNTGPVCAGGIPFPGPGILAIPLGFFLVVSGFAAIPGKQGGKR